MPHLTRSRPNNILTTTVIALILAMTVLVATAADGRADPGAPDAPLPGPDEYPKVAFVARRDIPADALSVGPVAGALGGIVLLTPTDSLSDTARDALLAFGPDVTIIAGGTAAITDATAVEIDAAGPWDTVRKSGPTREETAAELATVLDDYDVGRPTLTGDRQVIGDTNIGGRLHADSLAVESDDHVTNLNADLLDGLDSGDFMSADAMGLPIMAARVGPDGTVHGWFSQSGEKPEATQLAGDGNYRVEVPGLDIAVDNFVAQVSPELGMLQAGATWVLNADYLKVEIRDHAANGEDNSFHITVWAASPDG